VRQSHHVALLAAEGMAIDDRGRLVNQKAFWDFSEKCEHAYRAKVAATAPGAAGAGNLTLSPVPDDTAGATTFSQDLGIEDAETELDYIGEELDAALDTLHRQDHVA
jgi:hypothetical protein